MSFAAVFRHESESSHFTFSSLLSKESLCENRSLGMVHAQYVVQWSPCCLCVGGGGSPLH